MSFLKKISREFFFFFKLCSCGKRGKWLYMPTCDWTNVIYCDDCVPRECSCNVEYVHEHMISNRRVDDIYNSAINLPPRGKKWIWLNEGVSWTYVDNQGRRYPCCDFESLDDEYGY